MKDNHSDSNKIYFKTRWKPGTEIKIVNKDVRFKYSNTLFHVTGHDIFSALKPKCVFIGTIPSRAGIEKGFYYASGYSKFWQLLTKKSKYKIYGGKSFDLESCINFIEDNRLSFADIIRDCTRLNGLDSSIYEYNLNGSRVKKHITNHKIRTLFFTSSKAKNLFFNCYHIESEIKDFKGVFHNWGYKIEYYVLSSPSSLNKSRKERYWNMARSFIN